MIGVQYIKKEDVGYYLKLRNNTLGFMYLIFSLVLWIINETVTPKMMAMFTDLNMSLPATYMYAPMVMAIVILCSWILSGYYFFKKVDQKPLQKKLKRYKSNEMIRADQVLESRQTYLALLYFFAILLMFLVSIVWPIYNLTNGL